MTLLRTIALGTTVAVALTACGQMPVDHSAHHPPGDAPAQAGAGHSMPMMESHMKAMREMHEKLSRASTPEERQALMAEHMKLMHEGMAMMGGMGPGAMRGMGGMASGAGAGATPADPAARMQMMEKRMEMMQSMMQLMLDRIGPPPATR